MAQKPARRPRVDSVERMLEIIGNVSAGQLRPPVHVELREQDEPFWLGVIEARARDDWSPCDLVVAAQLARTQADIESEQKSLTDEGLVLESKDGKHANPRVSIVEALLRRELSLLRALRMGGYSPRATAGDLAARRNLERNAEKIAERVQREADDDRLLA